MDQATLVSLDLMDGQRVVNALEESEIKLSVAILMVSSDEDNWTLVLASPDLDHGTKLDAYTTVVRIARPKFHHMLPNIRILPMKDPFIRDLRKRYAKIKDIAGTRVRGQYGKLYIDEGYVYLLR
jgi:hypothetical protein